MVNARQNRSASPRLVTAACGVLRVIAVAVFFLWTMHGEAFADSIDLWLDYMYSDFQSESTDKITGSETNTDIQNFRQLYTLTLDRRLYPNLRFFGQLLAEFQESDGKTETISGAMINRSDIDAQDSVLRPYLDLTLKTQQLTLGGNISYRKDHFKRSGGESVTLYQMDKTAVFDWRPESLPSIQTRYLRSDIYDSNRAFQDSDQDFITLSSRYLPVEELELRYYGSYNEGTDHIDDTTSRTTNHSGQAIFARQFFGRMDLYGSYQITHSITEFESPGEGEFKFQVFANQGLFSINDLPETDTMNSNPALIDGNRDVTAGINIGSSLPLSGDSRLRNIGLDFFSSSRLDSLFVSVLSPSPQPELPSDVASTLGWEVFVSDDNVDWVLWNQPSFVFYDPLRRRFEIEFPSVQTRYIKVTVRPLSPTVPNSAQFLDIFITEIEAFETIPVSGDVAEFNSTRQNANFSSRIRLTEDPFLFYEVNYVYRKFDGLGRSSEEWTLSNGLSLNHKITGWLVGGARVAREDSSLERGKVTAYRYNASLTATPIETLRHTLAFSGYVEDNPDGTRTTNAISLYNNAQLYEGLDAYLNGGYSHTNTETAQRMDTTFVGAGMNIMPHRTVAINLNYSGTETNRSGGGERDSRTYTRRADAGISYSPLRTLYLIGTWSWVEQVSRTDWIQGYNVSWSPFPEGTLQLSFSYIEDIRSQDNRRNRTIRPYVRWNIRPSTYIDASYSIVKEESDLSKTDSQIFSTSLRIDFL